MITAGIGLQHAGIDGEPFALDQAGCHADGDETLEDVAKDVALPEPMEAVLGER